MQRFLSLLGFYFLASLQVAVYSTETCGQEAKSFRSIFDGESLQQWKATDDSYWTVEEGAITGTISPQHPCPQNQYLVWQGGELADFELKITSRLTGEGAINNGFQFRSRQLPDGDVCGYQVDNNLRTPWLVRLYDEYGRHDLALRGQMTTFSAEGKRETTPLDEVAEEPWFRLEDWHQYHLICRGTTITLYVDQQLVAKVVDEDHRRQDRQGILALQLHSGPTTRVQFKDIQLKILKEATRDHETVEWTQAQQNLKSTALAWWELETGGHGAQPPLQHFPQFYQFQWNVRAAGRGARKFEKVAQLDGAWLDAGAVLPASPEAFTVYVRGRIEGGQERMTILSRPTQGQGDGDGWSWQRTRDPETGRASFHLSFQTRADRMTMDVPLPKSGEDRFHDWVLRYNGQELTLIQDGEILGRHSCQALSPAGALRFAGSVVDGKVHAPFLGQLSVVAIWDRALTNQQVRQLGE